MIRRIHWQATLVFLVLITTLAAHRTGLCYQDVPASSASKTEDINTSASSENEADVLAFVEKHHSELLSVLKALKESQPKEYEAAIADIGKARKRLSQLEKRNKPIYDMEIVAWETQSKIDLMMARAVAKEHSLDEKALRELVSRRATNQVQRVKMELEQLQNREKQLRTSLERLEGNEKERIDQQVAGLLKKIDSKKPKNKLKVKE